MILGLAQILPITDISRSRVRAHEGLARRARTLDDRPIAALGVREGRATSRLHLIIACGGSDFNARLLRVKELGVRGTAQAQKL